MNQSTITQLQRVRSGKRDLQKLERELQREMGKLDTMIRQKAAQGVRKTDLISLCKRRTSIKKSIERVQKGINQLECTESKIFEAETNRTVLNSLQHGTQSMQTVNRMTNPKEAMQLSQEYQRESMRNAMMESSLDDLFSNPEVDQAADDEVNRVLMEVAGVKLDGMSLTPVARPATREASTTNSLQSILDNLY